MKRMLAYAVIIGLIASPVWAMETPVGCVVGGCSGHLCVSSVQADVVSTCEYQESYACYKQHGICETQPNGTCGWSDTPALKACLMHTSKPSEGAL